jgi:hypothetical protein
MDLAKDAERLPLRHWTRCCAATARSQQGIARQVPDDQPDAPRAILIDVDTQHVPPENLSSADWLTNTRTPPDARKPAGHEPIRGCRITLHDSVSTLNMCPEHGRMSGSGDQIVVSMYWMSDLTKPLGELCDSLILLSSGTGSVDLWPIAVSIHGV